MNTPPALSFPVKIFVGTLRPLPDNARLTGMFKLPVTAPIDIGPAGFAGDQQADRRVHGGPEKAVHLYPAAHYAQLAARFPEAADQLVAGSLGENLSAEVTEADVCIGDVFALGSARLQVCQPRNPCWKIDQRFGVDGMAAYIAETGLTGWYWRVLQTGRAAPDDLLTLAERPDDAITLGEAMALWQTQRPGPEALERIARAPGIAAGWQRKILDRAAWLRKEA